MTIAMEISHLGAVLRAGQELATARPLADRVASALAAATPALGAAAARVERQGRPVAAYGEPASEGPALRLPLHADETGGVLLVWQHSEPDLLTEQCWRVVADSVALVLRADDAAALAALAAAEAERDALAAELHDDLLQTLVAARLGAEFAGADSEPVRAALRAGRETVWLLRARTGSGRLVDAVDELASRVGAHGVDVAVDADATPAELPAPTATLAFRLAQAAVLAAVAAGAARVDIVMRPRGNNGVRLTVAHDAPAEPREDGIERWLVRLRQAGGDAVRGLDGAWLTFDVPGWTREGVRA